MNIRIVGFAVALSLCVTIGAFGQSTDNNKQQTPDYNLPGPWDAPYNGNGYGGGPVLVPAPGSTETVAEYEAIQKEELDSAQTAYAAENSGQFAVAEADAKQSLALGWGSGLTQVVLATSLYAQGQLPEAMQGYKKLADSNYNFPNTALPYALLLLKSGHWAQAVDEYNKAITDITDGDLIRANSDFSPSVPNPLDLETAIHIGMGVMGDGGGFYGTPQERRKESVLEFQKALDLEPNSPLANCFYGYGLKQAGETTEAKTAFTKTVKIASSKIKAAALLALKQTRKPA